MQLKHKEFHPRYITYYVHFPGDKQPWCVQFPFIHDLNFQLKQTKLMPQVKSDLLKKGESTWKPGDGTTHRVVIEEIQRPRVWGTTRKLKY